MSRRGKGEGEGREDSEGEAEIEGEGGKGVLDVRGRGQGPDQTGVLSDYKGGGYLVLRDDVLDGVQLALHDLLAAAARSSSGCSCASSALSWNWNCWSESGGATPRRPRGAAPRG